MGINQIWCVIPIIFVSMASIHNARLFDNYDIRSPFLGEVHAIPPSCFVPSSVYRWWDHCAMPSVSPAIIHLAGVALVGRTATLGWGGECEASWPGGRHHGEDCHLGLLRPADWEAGIMGRAATLSWGGECETSWLGSRHHGEGCHFGPGWWVWGQLTGKQALWWGLLPWQLVYVK